MRSKTLIYRTHSVRDETCSFGSILILSIAIPLITLFTGVVCLFYFGLCNFIYLLITENEPFTKMVFIPLILIILLFFTFIDLIMIKGLIGRIIWRDVKVYEDRIELPSNLLTIKKDEIKTIAFTSSDINPYLQTLIQRSKKLTSGLLPVVGYDGSKVLKNLDARKVTVIIYEKRKKIDFKFLDMNTFKELRELNIALASFMKTPYLDPPKVVPEIWKSLKWIVIRPEKDLINQRNLNKRVIIYSVTAVVIGGIIATILLFNDKAMLSIIALSLAMMVIMIIVLANTSKVVRYTNEYHLDDLGFSFEPMKGNVVRIDFKDISSVRYLWDDLGTSIFWNRRIKGYGTFFFPSRFFKNFFELKLKNPINIPIIINSREFEGRTISRLVLADDCHKTLFQTINKKIHDNGKILR